MNNFARVMIQMINSGGMHITDESIPLSNAACHGNVAKVQLLLDHGVDPTTHQTDPFRNPILGLTLLARPSATRDSINECAELLLYHGALPKTAVQESQILSDLLQLHKDKNLRNTLIAHLTMIDTLDTLNMNVDEDDDCLLFHEICQLLLKIKIFGTTSLSELLMNECESKMRIYARKEAFASNIENVCSDYSLSELCPYYYRTLKKRISEITLIVKLEDKAIPVICKILNSHFNECFVTARLIVGYLSKFDLEHLCQV